MEKALHAYVFKDKEVQLHGALEAHRAGLVKLSTPREFKDAVNAVMTDVAHDKHLHLGYSPDVIAPNAFDDAHDDGMDVFMDYGYSSSARLPGNVGYLRIGFFPPDAAATYDTAMHLLAHTDAMILDLRGNGGGSPKAVDYLLGYFVRGGTEITGFLSRKGDTLEPRRMFAAHVHGDVYTKPIYVLIDKQTFSGGEQCAYDLKALHRATLFGETTGGGANPGRPVRLNEHFAAFIPTGTARNPYTHGNWEGVGVSPDVATPSADALMQGYVAALKAIVVPGGPRRDDRDMALAHPLEALNIALPSLATPPPEKP